MNTFDLQPTLENDLVKIAPLREEDFKVLYAVASDPLVWEQHPNRDRYQEAVFRNFFRGAMESGGAFLVTDAKSGAVIGSSRYYDVDLEKGIAAIGYTFLGRSHWGGGYNPALKRLMLEHAFQFVDAVHFHIGALNIRSQTAMERLGGNKIGEQDIAYYGEPGKLNFVYEIRKEDWR